MTASRLAPLLLLAIAAVAESIVFPPESGVVDLMAALRKSLQGQGPGRERAERYTAAARANRKKPSPRSRKAA